MFTQVEETDELVIVLSWSSCCCRSSGCWWYLALEPSLEMECSHLPFLFCHQSRACMRLPPLVRVSTCAVRCGGHGTYTHLSMCLLYLQYFTSCCDSFAESFIAGFDIQLSFIPKLSLLHPEQQSPMLSPMYVEVETKAQVKTTNSLWFEADCQLDLRCDCV